MHASVNFTSTIDSCVTVRDYVMPLKTKVTILIIYYMIRKNFWKIRLQDLTPTNKSWKKCLRIRNLKMFVKSNCVLLILTF